MTYKIDRVQYEAAVNYLLCFSPKGFAKYSEAEDVKNAVEGMLRSLDPCEGDFVACGGIMVMYIGDEFVDLWVDPEYRSRSLYKDEDNLVRDFALKPEPIFQLV